MVRSTSVLRRRGYDGRRPRHWCSSTQSFTATHTEIHVESHRSREKHSYSYSKFKACVSAGAHGAGGLGSDSRVPRHMQRGWSTGLSHKHGGPSVHAALSAWTTRDENVHMETIKPPSIDAEGACVLCRARATTPISMSPHLHAGTADRWGHTLPSSSRIHCRLQPLQSYGMSIPAHAPAIAEADVDIAGPMNRCRVLSTVSTIDCVCESISMFTASPTVLDPRTVTL